MNNTFIIGGLILVMIILYILLNNNSITYEIIAYGEIGNKTEVLNIFKYNTKLEDSQQLDKVILDGQSSPKKMNFVLKKNEKLLLKPSRTKKTNNQDDNVIVKIFANGLDVTKSLILTKEFPKNYFVDDEVRNNFVKTGYLNWLGDYILE